MKITEKQLRRTIREAISNGPLREWGYNDTVYSAPAEGSELDILARELGLQRTDALMGAALELEARDPELSYVGRCPKSRADVYLRYDNTYTVEAYGERMDGLGAEELLDTLEQI